MHLIYANSGMYDAKSANRLKADSGQWAREGKGNHGDIVSVRGGRWETKRNANASERVTEIIYID